MTIEAMKQALEVIEAAIKAGDWKVDGACDPDMAIHNLRQAIEQAEKQEPVAWIKRSAKGNIIDLLSEPDDDAEPVYTTPQPQQDAWKNAAIRLGEELSSVGPDGYYNMTAEQWLDWAMDQQPNGKHSLPQPQREWVGLTLDEIDLLEELYAPPVHPDFVNDASHCLELIRHVEAKLKEKNT